MAQPEGRTENGKAKVYSTEFEDALYLTGTGKFHYLLLFICGLGLIGFMMETFGISFLLPSAQCDFNLSSADKGLLNAIYPVGMIFGAHMWGYLADTRGRKSAIVASFALDALCSLISSFVHIFWLFVVFRFLCGFLISGASSIIYAYFGEFHASETRNRGLMWLSIFIGIAIIIQPGIAWLIIPLNWEWHLPWCVYKPWRLFVTVCAVPNILSAITIALWLPETPKFLMSLGKKEEALNILKNMYTMNSGSDAIKYPVKSLVLTEDCATEISSGGGTSIVDLIVHMWNQTVPLFKPPLLWKTLLVCFVQYGLYASANGLSLWLPDIFNHQAQYFALHPNSRISTCQIYTTSQRSIFPSNTSYTNEVLSFKLHKPEIVDLQENDTLVFTCENNSLTLNVNNVTEIPIQPSLNILKCANDTLFHNLSVNILQTDVHNGTITLSALNTSNGGNLPQYKTEMNTTMLVDTNVLECHNDIDISAFVNSLIVGAVGAFAFGIVGFLIGPLGKKPIIVFNLLVGGIAGLLLDHVNANWEFFVMSTIFVTLSGMCIAVTVSVVVEIFPTNLRAMAVCLSLMCGRLGSVTAHMLMGALMESNCLLMTYLLGGLCSFCGIVSIFMPSPKKSA